MEKKDPPIIIKIKKIKDRFWGTSKENPILDIELQIDKKSNEKLLLMFTKLSSGVVRDKDRFEFVIGVKIIYDARKSYPYDAVILWLRCKMFNLKFKRFYTNYFVVIILWASDDGGPTSKASVGSD